MATPSSPSFTRLSSVYSSLAFRSDIDSLILELLGAFSLEKIYASEAQADKETYQFLLATLLAQLNAIFFVQRLSLPSADQFQSRGAYSGSYGGSYLGLLVSWEVTLRTVEFVLGVVVDGREALWEARGLRDRYLAELLVSALRILTLHPKAPVNQRAKDRRDRFARIHGSLERLYDSYPGQKSFLLLACKEITDELRREPNSLGLPTRLKYELPNLSVDLYPLPEVLSAPYVLSLVPQEGYSGSWLCQFLALRDISQFVIGASLQYSVKKDRRDFHLSSTSLSTRNAVLQALDNMRLPSHLVKADLVAHFSDIFRIIIPDTPHLQRSNSTESEEELGWDAIDALVLKLAERGAVSRASDMEVMNGIEEVTRNIALLDDPSASFKAARPKLWVLNCTGVHMVGDSQIRQSGDVKFPFDPGSSISISLLVPSKCPQCGDPVTIAREITLARQTWDVLKPLESNSEAINVERHQPSQFQLSPPKTEAGMPYHSAISTRHDSDFSSRHDSDAFSPYPTSPMTKLPELELKLDTTHNSTGALSSSNLASVDQDRDRDAGTRKTPSSAIETRPFSPDSVTARGSVGHISMVGISNIEQSATNVLFEPLPSIRTRAIPISSPPERKEPTALSWRSKLTGGSRKASYATGAASGDTSSLSSTTLEAQTLEEISLHSLASSGKGIGKSGKSGKSKGAKGYKESINVYLSQNSSHVLFWTQQSVHIWDIAGTGGEGSSVVRSIATESGCVLAACTRGFLAYVVGTRDMKLTLRVISLLQPTSPAMEYRMPSTPWCRSIAICPSENYIVVGFENSLVRFFPTSTSSTKTTGSGLREDHLHRLAHKGDCRECPSVDTLSFSADGLVLLASTRSPKSGLIQIYQWSFPFLTFSELHSCRYLVPLHESEDAGVSAAIFRSAPASDENLICITTWTQSGSPILIQPADGHRSLITPSADSHHSSSRKVGSRIQAASFSSSGRELCLVNDKGHVYVVSRLNSSPMDVTRVATSRELTAKADNFAMGFIAIDEGEAIILAWADASKGIGWVKKIPVVGSARDGGPSPSQATSIMHVISNSNSSQSQTQQQQQQMQYELPGDEASASGRPSIVPTPTMATSFYKDPVYAGYYGTQKLPFVDIKTPELGGDDDDILPVPMEPWEREPEVKFLVEEKKVVEKSKFRGRNTRP